MKLEVPLYAHIRKEARKEYGGEWYRIDKAKRVEIIGCEDLHLYIHHPVGKIGAKTTKGWTITEGLTGLSVGESKGKGSTKQKAINITTEILLQHSEDIGDVILREIDRQGMSPSFVEYFSPTIIKIVYKLTDENDCTHNNTQWGDNVTHSVKVKE